MRHICFVTVLGFLLSSRYFVSAQNNCPSTCSCYSSTYAFCENVNLTQPPNNGLWPDITYLDISYNNITSITDGMFSSFPSLESLYINYNQLDSVSVGAFRNMKIKSLTLDYNRITTLRYLDIPPSLYALTLIGNPLSFSDGSPLPLTASGLGGLDLSDVDLEKLDIQILSGLSGLEILIASENKISSIDLGYFFGMRNLQQLALDDNVIDTIIPPPDGIELQLLVLSIGFNKLTYLDPVVFKSLPKLTILNVEGNPIIVPDNRPLLSHSSLMVLDISLTYARNISSHTLDMPSLTWFFANDCGLYSVRGAFVNNPEIEWVSLAYNALISLDANTFATTGLLQELDLASNPLLRINLDELKASMSGGCNFCQLGIEDTPLACSCTHDELNAWADSNEVDIFDSCSLRWCNWKSASSTRISDARRPKFDIMKNITNMLRPSANSRNFQNQKS